MKELTQKVVNQLEASARGNKLVWDGASGVPGFGVCVTSAGVKSFVLDYRISGRKRRYTIGRASEFNVEAARYEAIELRARIKRGEDPLETKSKLRNEPTMDELCTAYLHNPQFQRKRESSKRNDRSMIDRTIRPKLGMRRVGAINQNDVARLHLDLQSTPYAANRTLSLLSTLFEFAKSEKLITDNPALGVKPFHEEERGLWLQVEQMKALDEALIAYATTGFPNVKRHLSVPPNPDGSNALRLMVLTGARMGEVLKSEWSDFDLERGKWKKPSKNTKQKEDEGIPLNPPTIALLLSMKPHNAHGPLFRGTKRKSARGVVIGGATRVSLIRPWLQVCKVAGLAEEYEIQGKRIDKTTGKPRMLKRWKPSVRRHDLRHNFASYLASSGVSLQMVGKLLGHKQTSTTERYASLYDEALRAATSKMGEVLPFRKVI